MPRLFLTLLLSLVATGAAGADRPSRAAMQRAHQQYQRSAVKVSSARGGGQGIFVGAEGQVLTSVQYVSLESAQVRHEGATLPASITLADATLKVAVITVPKGVYPAAPVHTPPEGPADQWLIGILAARGKEVEHPVTAVSRRGPAPFLDVDLPLPAGSPLFDSQGRLVAVSVERRGRRGCRALPLVPMRWRNEDYRDYGLTLRAWRQDVRLFLTVALVVFPLFFLAFALWVQVLPLLPEDIARLLAPFRGAADFSPRLPPRFGEWVVDQLLVVALPEEFFYRGYVQTRLRDAWPQGRLFLGARLGRAFWVTALLFALGHLAIFQVWRLSVFFPALLFGWMRERTGTVVGATLLHAASNLFIRFLEASFFGA